MNRRPRARVLLVAALLLALGLLGAEAAPALAAAGGGTSNFSDGGGGGGFSGGGGGGGGGGKGFALFILVRLLIDIALFGHGKGLIVLAVLAVAAYVYLRLWPKLRDRARATAEHGRASRHTTRKRERRVELAAAEASELNADFSPEQVRPAATALFKQVQSAWDQDDRMKLRGLLTPRLAGEWERRLDEMERQGWRNHIELLAEPKVEYVGLRNDRSGAKTVTVRIEARLRDYVLDRSGRKLKRTGQFTETTRLREYWTLESRDGRWVLASIEQGAEGRHRLEDQIVAADYADTDALRDEATLEQAQATRPEPDTSPADLVNVDVSTPARNAAADLSVADPRFGSDVIAVAARRAVSAWVQAVDGSTDALAAIATAQAVEQLLYPGHMNRRARVVVRGARVDAIDVTALDPDAQPPTLSLAVQITGRRYLQDRDTAGLLDGSSTRETTFVEHWTLALTGDAEQPWRIVDAGAAPTPARA